MYSQITTNSDRKYINYSQNLNYENSINQNVSNYCFPYTNKHQNQKKDLNGISNSELEKESQKMKRKKFEESKTSNKSKKVDNETEISSKFESDTNESILSISTVILTNIQKG